MAHQASLSFINTQSLLKFMSIESVLLSNHLILYHPLLLLPSISPASMTFPMVHSKYWSFSFSPSNEYSWMIFFSIDWFDLLAVQGTLQTFLEHHSLKASVIWLSALFMVKQYGTGTKTDTQVNATG